jgi:hypothetical protein
MDTDHEPVIVIEPAFLPLLFYCSSRGALQLAVGFWGIVLFIVVPRSSLGGDLLVLVSALAMLPLLYVLVQAGKLAGGRYYFTPTVTRFGPSFERSRIVGRTRAFRKVRSFGTVSYFFDDPVEHEPGTYFVKSHAGEIRKAKIEPDHSDGGVTLDVRFGHHVHGILGVRPRDWSFVAQVVE